MKIFWLSILCVVCNLTINILSARAQIIDYVQGYAGTRLFAADENIDAVTQLPQNIYAGFGPGQVIGGSAFRQVTDQLCLGGGFEITNNNKPKYAMNINTISAYAKYNLNNIERFISPYIIAGPNLSFVTYRQEQYILEVKPDLTNIATQNQLIYQDNILYREEKIDLFFVPVLGLQAGAGLEFKITEGWGLYGQYMFNYGFTKASPLLQQTYKHNTANMYYHNIVAGIRFFL